MCRIPFARLAVVVVILAPVTAAAQKPPQGPPKQTMSMDGVLQGVQAGLLQVVSDGGEPWLVKVEAKPENITYQASADPSWLQAGMYVQFQGRFDHRGKAIAPVSQITVITPKADTRLGAFPDGSLDASGELFGEAKVETSSKPQPETYALTVAGRLAGVENGKIRVAAGNAVLDAELADKPTILVELGNYALARRGDKVSVNGWYLQKGQGWANRLLVRAAQPLTGPKKEPRVAVSPEERKKAFDALEDLSAGDSAVKVDK